ncbi:S1 family peptidase [Bradyrhizobium australiense]|uniref:Trypsin-like peptidase domain-containing protein n=1 Tax=Bradyrhizobium australiense TaxID=2721161 RepID=A0A7Y4GS95_9BRAD|nr:serine protease [Bradyrhizobium australiense]NOJ40916.1 trypsin-like peptidase domain-containing protein [Bradyrhizobium australiense]
MLKRLSEQFAPDPPVEYGHLVKLLQIAASETDYQSLVTKTFSMTPEYERRKVLLLHGHFSRMDFIQLLHSAGDAKGTNIRSANELLRRLIEWSLVIDSDFGFNQEHRFQWSRAAIALFGGLDLIDNVLLGRSHVVEKYSRSIPAIIVRKNGHERIGTGFLTVRGGRIAPFLGEGIIVTAKHNVDPADGIDFVKFGDTDGVTYEARQSNWICHSTRDLAAMPVRVTGRAVPIHAMGQASVLSRTISLGYPTISQTDRAYLLAHNGELNAIVSSYLDKQKYLLISNTVAPGNSGGPVLDESGLCIGIVVQALEGQYDGGTSKANAAIPAADIQEFLLSLPQHEQGHH